MYSSDVVVEALLLLELPEKLISSILDHSRRSSEGVPPLYSWGVVVVVAEEEAEFKIVCISELVSSLPSSELRVGRRVLIRRWIVPIFGTGVVMIVCACVCV